MRWRPFIWNLVAPFNGELGRRFRAIVMTTIAAALGSRAPALGVWNCGLGTTIVAGLLRKY
jgi:multidrug efflux pump subunit AcrB